MKNGMSNILIAVGAVALAWGMIWGIAAMTVNNEGAAAATSAMGFTHVEVEDSGFMFTSFRGCDEKDLSWYKVNAVNVNGDHVRLRVCRGLLKGYTVRVK